MRRRVFLEWLLVAVLAFGAVLLLAGERLTLRADNALYDALTLRRAELPSRVVIVAIDEQSLDAIGRWPWSRDVHTALLERLAAMRPAAIGYDVLFVEPSPKDVALAEAGAHTGALVLPMTFSQPGANGAPFDAELPVPAIARAARGIGHADFEHDRDGVVRRVSLLAGDARASWPAFAEQVYRVARGRTSDAYRRAASHGLAPDSFSLASPILIPFSGPSGLHRRISLVSVLRGEVPDELLRGRILLVGSTASGSGDQYAVPTGAMAGVEIQANVVDALLAGRTVRAARSLGVLSLALVPLSILLAGVLLLPPRVSMALGAALLLGVLATSAVLLLRFDLWVPPVASLAGLMIVYPLWGWRRLEAANAYMVRELTQLRGEDQTLLPSLRRTGTRRWLQEPIAQQADLLHLAIERVRSLRRFFADSLAELPDATLVLDRGRRVLVANKAAEALFGPIHTSEHAPAFADLLAALVPGGEAGHLDDREVTTPDGRTLVLRCVPLLDAGDVTVGSIVRLTDITAIRLATRQRENALQLLTHDMRSPQASILALLRRPPEDEQALYRQIGTYAQRTLALADNFVQLARAETARPAEELLDMGSLMVEAADDQWVLANGKGIAIDVVESDCECLVRGDRSLLSRMLINLIGNAVKYSGPDTTVTCSVELVEESEDRICLCRIADQGRGIPPDQLPNIFRSFYRVAEEGRDRAGGVGLGLAFVETVVTRHGGTITCESVVGRGTAFTIRLPAIGGREDPISS